MPQARPTLMLSVLALIAAPSFAPAQSSGANSQLRESLRWTIQRAGVSDPCIDALSTSELAQVKAIADQRPRSSRDRIRQDQRIRNLTQDTCDTVASGG